MAKGRRPLAKEKGPATFAGGANKREVLGKRGSR